MHTQIVIKYVVEQCDVQSVRMSRDKCGMVKELFQDHPKQIMLKLFLQWVCGGVGWGAVTRNVFHQKLCHIFHKTENNIKNITSQGVFFLYNIFFVVVSPAKLIQ